jgi:uncharacterized protein (DUF427 family)
VVLDGELLAETERAVRILETGGAPVYAIPRADVRMDRLVRSPHATVCEWKGAATYYTYRHAGREVANVAWSYERPNSGYESIAGHLSFYAGLVDEAWVGDERAAPQPGGFYGGWVTSRVVGPFKGEPGSFGW